MQPRLLRLLQYQPRNNIRNDRSTLSFNHDHRSNGLHDRKASPLCRFNTIGLQHSAICISLEKQCRTHENECKLGNAQTNCPKTHVRCTVQSRPAAFLFGAASQILHIQLLCSFELPKKKWGYDQTGQQLKLHSFGVEPLASSKHSCKRRAAGTALAVVIVDRLLAMPFCQLFPSGQQCAVKR